LQDPYQRILTILFERKIILSKGNCPTFMHRDYWMSNGTLFYDMIDLGYYTIVVHLEDKE